LFDLGRLRGYRPQGNELRATLDERDKVCPRLGVVVRKPPLMEPAK